MLRLSPLQGRERTVQSRPVCRLRLEFWVHNRSSCSLGHSSLNWSANPNQRVILTQEERYRDYIRAVYLSCLCLLIAVVVLAFESDKRDCTWSTQFQSTYSLAIARCA